VNSLGNLALKQKGDPRVGKVLLERNRERSWKTFFLLANTPSAPFGEKGTK